jgi:protein-S-isoprenylcysteine O-methyltransferase Ste14
MRNIDIPPFWLCAALALSWALSALWSWPFPQLGKALVGAGLVLMLSAAAQMILARTSVIPRRDPKTLVSTKLFAISRNPIYLADAIILTGGILYWGAVLALPVIPVFAYLITQRFILAEEARLRVQFGAAFDLWANRVPRWIW